MGILKKEDGTLQWEMIGISCLILLITIGATGILTYSLYTKPIYTAYTPIDTILCQPESETPVIYHTHTLFAVYINNKRVQIPANIGVSPDGRCQYWVHTENRTDVIHIEAPKKISATLGMFLDIWKDKFPKVSYINLLGSTEAWKVYVNGKLYTGNIRNIPLPEHTIITLLHNSPEIQPITTYNWGVL